MPVDNDIYNRMPTAWWGETESPSLLRTGINPARCGSFRAMLADPSGSLRLANAASILAEGEHYEDHCQGNHPGLV